MNACDAGREGELIFAYVLRRRRAARAAGRARLVLVHDPRRRSRTRSTTLRPGAELRPLEDAARSRSEADWLVGDERDPRGDGQGARARRRDLARPGADADARDDGAARAGDRGLRAGRRTGSSSRLRAASGERRRLPGRWFRGAGERLSDGPRAEAIASGVRGQQSAPSPSCAPASQRQPPPLLYDLTALQREAASWYGFTARRTLSAAQGCYEKAVLTYPRTSSRYLSTDMIEELREIAEHVGRVEPGLPQGRRLRAWRWTSCRSAGSSTTRRSRTTTRSSRPNAPHDGVADGGRAPASTTWPPAASWRPSTPRPCSRTPRSITEVAGETFRSRGRVLIEAGWRAAYGKLPSDEARAPARPARARSDEQPEQELPRLREGEDVNCDRGRRRRPRDQAAAALRRGRAARRDGGRRQAHRRRRAARRDEGLRHRHARRPGRRSSSA